MPSPSPISIATYNMHKGMSPLNRFVYVDNMAEAIKSLRADILFLQEVQGENLQRQFKLPEFPDQPHYDILGQRLAYHSSYGKNAVYKEKHHGNAILSHLPIDTRHNLNITVNKLEKRGVLHCEIQPEGWPLPIVCLCAHLNLLETDRVKQYTAIFEYVTTYVHPQSPLILAGDFNDWRQKSCLNIGRTLGLTEVFVSYFGSRPKTFPARMPLLSLDRIYTRNLRIIDAKLHNSAPWLTLSDHLPLSATLVPILHH
ncbi:MAG: endonuclease/exonuclease/phosphatase family protein [Neisseria sp.]|uniref:endonuclease/exonuclease/phosphatase family protein n=1 Tax=Neisseria sp. TaxID=192066 RepID=UPI0026DBC125|nr:endonuclease/exonuclease/phosphatase family protein [Neisseria sp.]MDO4641175.1 endonuclease/exonuclease/phosphatase family protein [Neisseria sp.]